MISVLRDHGNILTHQGEIEDNKSCSRAHASEPVKDHVKNVRWRAQAAV
jgi:hypothetical protein